MTKETCAARDVERDSYTAKGMYKDAATMEVTMVSPQNTFQNKAQVPCRLAVVLLPISKVFKVSISQRYLHSHAYY